MKKIVMFISAFLPMFWIILIKDFITIISKIYKKELECKALCNIWLLGSLVATILVSVCFCILIYRSKNIAKDKVKVLKVENKTVEYYLEYFSLFILALLTFSFTNWIDVLVMVLVLTVLGVVYIKNDLYYINPTLNLIRKFIYKVEYYNCKNELVSKIVMANKKIKNGINISIYVSDYEFTFADVEEQENEHNDKKAD